MKKFLTVLGIILAILLAFNFLMISVAFHRIAPDGIAKIQVSNGLTLNQFTITELRDIQIVTSGINGLHPYLWFGVPVTGYVYFLRFYDFSGTEIYSITVAGDDTLISGRSLLLADCTEILSILSQLESWYTISG